MSAAENGLSLGVPPSGGMGESRIPPEGSTPNRHTKPPNRNLMSRNYKHVAPDHAERNRLSRRSGVSYETRVLTFTFVLICALTLVSIFLPRAGAQSLDELPGIAELKKGDYEAAIKFLTARLG